MFKPFFENMPEYEAIAARFRSGNSVQIDRATVTLEEWESFLEALYDRDYDLSCEYREPRDRD